MVEAGRSRVDSLRTLPSYYGGPPRLPLSMPTPEAKKEIEEAFKDLSG